MKKKMRIAVFTALAVVACLSAVVVWWNGGGGRPEDPYRTAAQCHKRLAAGKHSKVMGYFGEIPITRDQVDYAKAMSVVSGAGELDSEEALLEVAKRIYVTQQSKELGYYPSEEELERIRSGEEEAFYKNEEENIEFCKQVGLTREELVAWTADTQIEGKVEGDYMVYILEKLREQDEIGDVELKEWVEAFYESGSPEERVSLIEKICNRYLSLQVQDKVSAGGK